MHDSLNALEAIDRRLTELEQGDAQLARPLDFYRKLLPVLRQAQPLAPALEISSTAAQTLIDSGQSILASQSVAIAVEPARGFFRQVGEVIAEFQPSAREALQALENQRLDLATLLESLAAGRLDAIEPAAETAEVSPVLLRMLLEYTLRPTLRAWAEQLQKLISFEHWQQPRCPVCDSPALLSEIRGIARDRYLRCGICGAAWPYPRLQCALCANTDPRSQGMVCEDGEERIIYAHTCRRCHGYIKCLYTPGPLLADLLPVEDLVTLYLDQGCQERGYSRSPAQ